LGKPCHTSRLGGNNAHPAPAVGAPPPAALCPSPRPPACGWDARRAEGACGPGSVGARLLHRDADAQPARAWRRCAETITSARAQSAGSRCHHALPARKPTRRGRHGRQQLRAAGRESPLAEAATRA
jgi:hypothetical protein